MTQMLCINVCPNKTHCVKSVQIRSYVWCVFSCIRTEVTFRLNGIDKIILVHFIITSFKNTFNYLSRGNIDAIMISESKLETADLMVKFSCWIHYMTISVSIIFSRAYSRHWRVGEERGGLSVFFEGYILLKRAFCLLAIPKQTSFLIVQSIRLGGIFAPNKGLE